LSFEAENTPRRFRLRGRGYEEDKAADTKTYKKLYYYFSDKRYKNYCVH
jgi:deoxyadenosine/deoxycytidine kinase